MTKAEAKRILACSRRVKLAVDNCLAGLNAETRNYAEAYWAAHLKSIAAGTGYGSMPIAQAELTLEVA